MTKSQILFLDIDGTILLPDHTIQPSTIEAIKQVKDQGIEVFLATGRPLHEITELITKLEIDSCIGYNGGYAIYQNEEIYQRPMKRKIVKHFIETSARYKQELVLYRKDANLFTNMTTNYVNHFISYFDLKLNRLYQPVDRDDILGITVMNLPEDYLDHYQTDSLFLSQVNVDRLRDSYDVIQKDVNKGVAIKAILTRLAIDPENAIAFGDGLNDREMLSVVGKSFAMGNANPNLFQYANYQTTNVNDNGIFNGLKQLGLVK